MTEAGRRRQVLRVQELAAKPGGTIGDAAKKVGVTPEYYYRWKKNLSIEGGKRYKIKKKKVDTIELPPPWTLGLFRLPAIRMISLSFLGGYVTSRLLRIFWETDMRCRHDGLTELALKEDKIKFSKLKFGDVLCFVNRKKDRYIMLSPAPEANSRGVLAYYRSPRGRFEERALQYVGQTFGGGKINYDEALHKVITEMIKKKRLQT